MSTSGALHHGKQTSQSGHVTQEKCKLASVKGTGGSMDPGGHQVMSGQLIIDVIDGEPANFGDNCEFTCSLDPLTMFNDVTAASDSSC